MFVFHLSTINLKKKDMLKGLLIFSFVCKMGWKGREVVLPLNEAGYSQKWLFSTSGMAVEGTN